MASNTHNEITILRAYVYKLQDSSEMYGLGPADGGRGVGHKMAKVYLVKNPRHVTTDPITPSLLLVFLDFDPSQYTTNVD